MVAQTQIQHGPYTPRASLRFGRGCNGSSRGSTSFRQCRLGSNDGSRHLARVFTAVEPERVRSLAAHHWTEQQAACCAASIFAKRSSIASSFLRIGAAADVTSAAVPATCAALLADATAAENSCTLCHALPVVSSTLCAEAPVGSRAAVRRHSMFSSFLHMASLAIGPGKTYP